MLKGSWMPPAASGLALIAGQAGDEPREPDKGSGAQGGKGKVEEVHLRAYPVG